MNEAVFGSTFAEKYTLMAVIGYIKNPQSIKDAEWYREKMRDLGCHKIYEDDASCSKHRLHWRYILENKTEGDTIIVYKLSNALGGWVELPMFLKMCQDNRIRLVSLKDRLDTSGMLFNTSVEDFLPVLANFGKETYDGKPHFTNDLPKEKSVWIVRERKKYEQTLLEKSVINDYVAGRQLEQIIEKRGVSQNTLYRMLRKYDIQPQRKVGSSYSKKPETKTNIK